jgi:hypothetical protein
MVFDSYNLQLWFALMNYIFVFYHIDDQLIVAGIIQFLRKASKWVQFILNKILSINL